MLCRHESARAAPGVTVAAYRCAAQAELRGDSKLGTAFPQARVLLVEQPGPWGPRGLLESRCEASVAQRIDIAAGAAGMRLQAIRRPGKHELGPPIGGYRIGLADTRAEVPSIVWWRTTDLSEVAVWLEDGCPARLPVVTDVAPLFLICAHGRHDACCALRGRPLAQELQRVRPERAWETTHLGGDRFAANVLVLPTGELYGQVSPLAAAELADRADAGEVMPGLMRGRVGLTPIAQAALVFAHERLALAARAAVSVISVQRVAADVAQVNVLTPAGSAIVTVAIEVESRAQLSCRGPQSAQARAYHGVAITSLGAGPGIASPTA